MRRASREAGGESGVGRGPAEEHGHLAGNGYARRFEHHEDEHGQVAVVLDGHPYQVLQALVPSGSPALASAASLPFSGPAGTSRARAAFNS